jgi:tetratricopeptide (TPR) repeat protein
LGKALLTEKEVEGMSLRHKKLFLFNLGNAYFLSGNYADAKRRYSECINSEPARELRVRAYNNLGLACWWHKNPLFGEKVEGGETVDADYRQSR